jgi:hypothetical protein
MKQALLIFIGILLVTELFSQSDSTTKPTFWGRPYFENGIAFIRNDYLKDSYETNSMYHWGLGLRFGNPNISKLLPYMQYSNSTYKSQKVDANNEKVDSTLRIQEFMVGFNIPIKRFHSNMLRAKVGYTYSMIDDDYFNNSDKANGLQVGLGYEAKIFGKSRVYIEYSYDFNKLLKASFRDYDIQKISLGFIL